MVMDQMGKIADISKWQGNVNWSEAAKELDLVILRASCGTSEDTKYERNVNACIENGIPFGAYHYVKAGTAAADENPETASGWTPLGTLTHVIDDSEVLLGKGILKDPGDRQTVSIALKLSESVASMPGAMGQSLTVNLKLDAVQKTQPTGGTNS